MFKEWLFPQTLYLQISNQTRKWKRPWTDLLWLPQLKQEYKQILSNRSSITHAWRLTFPIDFASILSRNLQGVPMQYGWRQKEITSTIKIFSMNMEVIWKEACHKNCVRSFLQEERMVKNWLGEDNYNQIWPPNVNSAVREENDLVKPHSNE